MKSFLLIDSINNLTFELIIIVRSNECRGGLNDDWLIRMHEDLEIIRFCEEEIIDKNDCFAD